MEAKDLEKYRDVDFKAELVHSEEDRCCYYGPEAEKLEEDFRAFVKTMCKRHGWKFGISGYGYYRLKAATPDGEIFKIYIYDINPVWKKWFDDVRYGTDADDAYSHCSMPELEEKILEAVKAFPEKFAKKKAKEECRQAEKDIENIGRRLDGLKTGGEVAEKIKEARRRLEEARIAFIDAELAAAEG